MLAFVLFTLSCKKSETKSPEPTELTSCPANTNCRYGYTDGADLTSNFPALKAGSNRIFWSEVKSLSSSTFIYVKAPMDVKSFSLTKEDILAGLVDISTVCPTCFSAVLKPVDGYVNGVNITDRSGKNVWLIEAKLIMPDVTGQGTPQTYYIKQYFYPGTL